MNVQNLDFAPENAITPDKFVGNAKTLYGTQLSSGGGDRVKRALRKALPLAFADDQVPESVTEGSLAYYKKEPGIYAVNYRMRTKGGSPDIALLWNGTLTRAFETIEGKDLQRQFYPYTEEKTAEIEAIYGEFAIILADTQDKDGWSEIEYNIEKIGDIPNPFTLLPLNTSDTKGAVSLPDEKRPYLSIDTGTGDIPVEVLEEYFETGEQMKNAGATEGSAATFTVPPNSTVEVFWQLVSLNERSEQDGLYLTIDGNLTLLGDRDPDATYKYETSQTVISSPIVSTFDVGESGEFSLLAFDKETEYGTSEMRVHRISYKPIADEPEPSS
ncbi:MAG: hypothetical protein F6J93_34450 [Oscillatoria sp. SIO1A7]|nr:hypothetical protein [Oscillatoria sp. SIO1A7]